MSMNQAPTGTSNAVKTLNTGAGDSAGSFTVEGRAERMAGALGQAEEPSSTDVLVQLRSNLSQLDELHGRLRFVMAEVSYLLKRE